MNSNIIYDIPSFSIKETTSIFKHHKGLTIIDPLPINYILFENNEYSGDLWVEKNRPT